jgi:hypothetical protein
MIITSVSSVSVDEPSASILDDWPMESLVRVVDTKCSRDDHTVLVGNCLLGCTRNRDMWRG